MRIMKNFMALLAIVMSGCISVPTHERLMNKLRAQLKETQEQNQQMAEQLAQQSQESEQLKQESEQLKVEGERLKEEVTRVRSTYDEMVHALKEDIAAGDVGVKETTEGLTVTMGDAVLFQSGKAEIQPRGQKILVKVSRILKTTEDKHIQVEGHTDNIPISGALKSRYETNWDLSAARSASVVQFLIKKGKVPAERLILTAFGDTRPLAENNTSEGRQKNRRVEIKLVP